MKNKTIGVFLISSVSLAILAYLGEDSVPSISEFLYTVSGLGMLVFGIWGGVRLTKDVK